MAIGYFIGLGDKTSCGGKVLEADSSMMMFGFARAREGDRVSCGANGKSYQIVGGILNMRSNGRMVAGTLDSVSSCPCRAKLIASNTGATYQSSNGTAPTAAPTQRSTPTCSNKPARSAKAGGSPARRPSFHTGLQIPLGRRARVLHCSAKHEPRSADRGAL